MTWVGMLVAIFAVAAGFACSGPTEPFASCDPDAPDTCLVRVGAAASLKAPNQEGHTRASGEPCATGFLPSRRLTTG